MNPQQLQEQCELGQQQLMRTEYLEAISTLAAAEHAAWEAKDFDTLARLYMPLQEARRQARQRCGEGVVRLDCIAAGPGESPSAQRLLDEVPHGQLLVAGWGSIEPALQVRQLARQRNLYVETFLGAVYPTTDGSHALVIVPMRGAELPSPESRDIDTLASPLWPNALVINPNELPHGPMPGNTEAYARVMAIWERLHMPFLHAADATSDPLQKMAGYRTTIEVDPACELAHQRLSDVARSMRQRA
jgi:hypothetical protein